MQWDYYSFNVIPNEPAQAGLQIPSFINNLGTNIFLPNITILRRYEFADNFSMIRGHHAFKFGAYELSARQSHRIPHFFPRALCLRHPPRRGDQPVLCSHAPRIPAGVTTPAGANHQLAASRHRWAIPEVYQQGFGDPTYGYYARPLTGALRAGFLEGNAEFHSELRSPLGTGHTIRPFDHLQEGFCPPGLLRVGSLQGSQDGGPRGIRNLLRTRRRSDSRRRLEPGGCKQE